MGKNVRIDMKKRARILSGLLNLLKDDVDQITIDTNTFDLICLEESIQDIRRTLEFFTDNVKELEYLLYLTKKDDSRGTHTIL